MKGPTNASQPTSKALLRNNFLKATPVAEGLLHARHLVCATSARVPRQPAEASYALLTAEKLRLREGKDLLKVTQPLCWGGC